MVVKDMLAAAKKNAEDKVRAAGRKGLIIAIGFESASIRELVEDGIIYEEIALGGHAYKYTHPDVVDRNRKKR